MKKLLLGTAFSLLASSVIAMPEVTCTLKWGEPTGYFETAGISIPATRTNTIWFPGPVITPGIDTQWSMWHVTVRGVVGYHMSPIVPRCTVWYVNSGQPDDEGVYRGINLVIKATDPRMEDWQLAVYAWNDTEERTFHIKYVYEGTLD